MLAPSPSSHQAAERPEGFLARLFHSAKEIVFPFDRVLCGMVAAGLCADALCAFLGLTRALLETHVVRLGVRTPSDASYRQRLRGWSLQDTQRVIAWRTVGVHPEVIGDNLSLRRSANAVRSKSRRLGLPAPARRDLFRPDASQLIELLPEAAYPTCSAPIPSPVDICGRPAGPVQSSLQCLPEPAEASQACEQASGPADPTCPPAISSPTDICGRPAGPIQSSLNCALEPAEPSHEVAAPWVKQARSTRKVARPAGQRELPLLGVVAGSDVQRLPAQPAVPAPSVSPVPVPAPVPATVADVDLSNLTWLARVAHPLCHEPSVWVVGMLMMAGLHYHAAAVLTGRTAASLRTLRTRMGVPVDLDRKKQTGDFDLDVARNCHEENGYIIRKAVLEGGPRFFWIHKSDRSTRLPPTHRKRDHMIEGRWPLMTITTRKMLDERRRASAGTSAMIRAVA